MVSKSVTKKTHEIIKRELLNSLQENDDVEEQGLNERANNVNNSQEGIRIINRYEDIIKTHNKKQFLVLVNKENFKKSSKIQKTFLIIFVKADQQYIFKFPFISFSINTCYLKNQRYN